MYLKDLFPKDIWELIFSFDPTYHETYYKTKMEFMLKTALWRVKWLNRDIDYGDVELQKKYKPTDFQSTRKGIGFVINYWNESYPDYYRPLDKPITNCESEFITDNFKSSRYLFNHLNILKNYQIKNSKDSISEEMSVENNWVLYKPGKYNKNKIERSFYWSKYVKIPKVKNTS